MVVIGYGNSCGLVTQINLSFNPFSDLVGCIPVVIAFISGIDALTGGR